MGAKMAKKDVIYGMDRSKVAVTAVRWSDVEDAIEKMLGEDVKIDNLPDARKAVAEAKKGKHSSKTYVKVGLVKSDLVLRVKTPRKVGFDKEVDTVLVKNAKRLAKQFQQQQARDKEQRDASAAEERSRSDVDRAEAALAHRTDMIKFQRDYKVEVEGQLAKLTDLSKRIDKALDDASTGGRLPLDQRLRVEDLVKRLADDADKIIKAVQRRYKKVIAGSGPLMKARGDFQFRDKGSVDRQWLARWTRDFNQAFSDGDAHMQKANDAITEMRDTIRHVRARRDEAEALAGHMSNVIAILSRLDDLREDASDIAEVATKKANQAEGASSSDRGLWSHVLADPVVAPAAAMRKQFSKQVPAWKKVFETLPEGRKRLDDIQRSLDSIPREAMDEAEVAKEVGELRQLLAFGRSEIDRGLAWHGSFKLLVTRGQEVLDSLGD